MKIALFHLAFVLALIGFSIYGVVLAFKASIVLGFLVLLVEPAPTVLGLIAFFGNPDIAERLAAALGLS